VVYPGLILGPAGLFCQAGLKLLPHFVLLDAPDAKTVLDVRLLLYGPAIEVAAFSLNFLVI